VERLAWWHWGARRRPRARREAGSRGRPSGRAERTRSPHKPRSGRKPKPGHCAALRQTHRPLKGACAQPTSATAPPSPVFSTDLLAESPPPLAGPPHGVWCPGCRLRWALGPQAAKPMAAACLRRSLTSPGDRCAFQACRLHRGRFIRLQLLGAEPQLEVEIRAAFALGVDGPIKPRGSLWACSVLLQ